MSGESSLWYPSWSHYPGQDLRRVAVRRKLMILFTISLFQTTVGLQPQRNWWVESFFASSWLFSGSFGLDLLRGSLALFSFVFWEKIVFFFFISSDIICVIMKTNCYNYKSFPKHNKYVHHLPNETVRFLVGNVLIPAPGMLRWGNMSTCFSLDLREYRIKCWAKIHFLQQELKDFKEANK